MYVLYAEHTIYMKQLYGQQLVKCEPLSWDKATSKSGHLQKMKDFKNRATYSEFSCNCSLKFVLPENGTKASVQQFLP
jgi:hypothetical protein